MKSFLKKAAIAAVAGAMVFGLAGCGGEKKEAASSKNPKEVTIYTVIVGGYRIARKIFKFN